MKKIISIFFILFAVSSGKVMADENYEPGNEIKAAFLDQFPQAKNVHFEHYNHSVLVFFTEYCRRCLAVYQDNDFFVGNGYFILREEIPGRIIHHLEKRFGKIEIRESLMLFTEDCQSIYCLELYT